MRNASTFSLLPLMLAGALGFCGIPAAGAGEAAHESITAALDAGFTELERQMVEDYFGRMPPQAIEDETVEAAADTGKGKKPKDGKRGGKNKDLPPGLAKRDSLPPGLAKRETLPPGLEQRSLPADLEEQLPPPPPGYERQIVADAAVVLIDKATGRVADIIMDILIPPADD